MVALPANPTTHYVAPPSDPAEPLVIRRLPWTRTDASLLAVLGVLLAAYYVYTWGVAHMWWDASAWQMSIWRASQGVVPWRDYTWPYPPLAFYALGAVAEVFGPAMLPLRIANLAICTLIVGCQYAICRELIPAPVLAPLVVGTSILAIAQSRISGSGMAAGMYTPTATIGLFFALLGLFATIRLLKGDGCLWFGLGLVGVSGALLTKQDFWPPALLVAVVLIATASGANLDRRRSVRAALGVAAGLIILTIGPYLVLLKLSGASDFLQGLQGYQPSSTVALLVPSWPFLLDQVVAPLSWAAGLATIGWLCGAHRSTRLVSVLILATAIACVARFGLTYLVAVAVSHGQVLPGTDHPVTYESTAAELSRALSVSGGNLVTATLRVIGTGLLRNWLSFSCLLGLIVLWLTARSRQTYTGHLLAGRERIILFLGAWAVLAGGRRLFENSDPVQFLVVPVFGYVVFADLYRGATAPLKRRFTTAAFTTSLSICILGLLSFTWFEILPRIAQPYRWLDTPFGDVYLPGAQADEVSVVLNISQTQMPAAASLLSVPYAGLNYLVARPDPTRLFSTNREFEPPGDVDRELERLPAATWVVIDCGAVDCNYELAMLQADTRRQYEIVRRPAETDQHPAFLVARPIVDANAPPGDSP